MMLVRSFEPSTSKEIADLVGKEIRKKYYRMRFDLVSKNLNEITLIQSLKNLASAEGESGKFSLNEIKSVETWNENHPVDKAFILSLELGHQGGTAIEQFTIFLPKEKHGAILIIGRSVYAE